ncbi:Pro-apoptotic serine protease NMA111 [Lepidopterella palustris CBS 459.81]|uniref:Pro-apoptotic serine protease NMA111 n=1 Tax=Lepidopterella palustris CBS 459.81 TaxID=1314670 RepID=A0A8E2J9B5_9PEZI|nr:Pro-apoptotic serine protease NMA111 [Lepidopterella palustris CBS 459.81]
MELPESDSEEILSTPHVAATQYTAEWQKTIGKVIKSVVSIHFCQTCPFDTDTALASQATGLVVDAEKGFILTNRHVVCAGPFQGYCIFDNHEEVDVYPVYRDPVHDFGILKFDPKAIKHMPVTSLELRPDLACVGAEIRVVGNDAGQKLSILSGVISRLDRNAPDYGEGYNDFNTNYIQAAAAATGGSSGSPVINKNGFVVALQAGGTLGAATDFFLPLDRPLRALECIRNGQSVSRGTIQVQWIFQPFDECRKLGLSNNWEASIRFAFPKETGMLMAKVVLPKGPADKKIEEGDLLINVNGKLLTQFISLGSILDSSVGGKVSVLVQRGGEDINIELNVENLHDITPDRFVSVAGALFHDLSYQHGRLYAIPVKNQGVFISKSAGSFAFQDIESGWLLQSIDHKDTPNLDAFIEVMKEIPDRARVVVTYKHLRNLHMPITSTITIERHWHQEMRMAKRNDETGVWDYSVIAGPVPPTTPVTRKANFVRIDSAFPQAVDIVRSFVRVSVSMPVKLDGFPTVRKVGYGLVLDADQGLVIVSRAFVPHQLCDISLTIADSIIVDAKVEFMHPLQNYAIIRYNPALVDAPVKTPKLATEFVKRGEETIFFGFNKNLRPLVIKTVVTDITTVSVPSSASTPRYRATNVDAVAVDASLAGQCRSGVLVKEDGTVQALWLACTGPAGGVEYTLGLATPMVLPVLKKIQTGFMPQLRILDIETYTEQMSQCRIMEVSEQWIEKVEREDRERHQLFIVHKVDSGHNGGLEEGDVILTLNGKLITRAHQFDIMYNNRYLDIAVVRKGEELLIKVPTVSIEDLETDRVVIFCGATLQRPHHAVRQWVRTVHSDVYVSDRAPGSPSDMYDLEPTNFLTHVNGVPTSDLTSFLKEVKKIADNQFFRLKVITLDNLPKVVTMKKTEHYFPTTECIKDLSEELGWKMIRH